MATVRAQKPTASAKYDTYVEEQLDKARRRIRVLDVSVALLLLAAVTLGYALVVGLLDRKLDLAPFVRQVTFTAFAVVAFLFVVVGVIRPLFRRINPYYAAHAVEGVVPGAKNSLVNWLDLHEETLPPAIRASLSQRAAKDLARGDLEQAISGRRAVWLTAVTALLAFAMFGVLVTSGTGGFGNLLARTFAPFGGGATARRTQLTVVSPANGDAVLGVGQSFNVAVRVEGRAPDPEKPDALKLLYRYRDGEPYEEQPLEPENGDLWMTVVPPSRTFNGFWYKVTGGDAETPEYHVTVRSTPLVERFEVTYHYRPYTGWTDSKTHDANLTALRGTDVELVVHTNRPVKEGRLEVETRDGNRTIAAELIAGAPQAMRARLVMEQDGQYRVLFKTTDEDSNVAAVPYTIKVLTDFPPKAELTKPGADVTLPANGTLRLEGFVTDDIGVKEVTLRLRQADGAGMQPKRYLPERSLRLGDVGYPKKIDYRDFLALDQLKDAQGKPFPLATGMVLEYWLEAADACDYPGPNPVAESKHFKITISEQTPDKQQQQKERTQAAEEQKKHEKKQEEQLKKEEQERKEDAKEQEEQRRNEEAGGKPGQEKGGKSEQPQKPEEKDPAGQAKELGNALQKQAKEQQREQDKGQSKGPQDGKGSPKGDNQADQPPPQDKGDAKPEGQKGDGQQGSDKGEGAKQDGKKPDTGNGKPESAQQQDAAPCEGKGSGKGDQQGAASAKPDGPPKPDKGDKKNAGKGDESQNAAAPKEHGDGQNGDKGEGAAKGAGQEKAGDPNDKAAAKGDQPTVTKGAPKPGEAGGEPKGAQKREGKPQGDAAKGEGKPGGTEKNDGGGAAKGAAKDDPNKRSLSSELPRREQQARQGTDKQSADAEKWLESLARNANDKDVRDLAKKVLEDARKDRASSPALPKGPPPEDAPDGPPCQCKGGVNVKDTGASKSGGKDTGSGKGQGIVQVPPGASRDAGGRDGPTTSLTPGQMVRLQALGADEAQPTPGDPAHRLHAGALQLEDWTKIDKNILKDLKMTPEQLEAFKQAYTAKLRRDEEEQRPGSQNDRGIGNREATEVKADKSTPGGDRTGLGQVPPEYRRPFRDYTRQQSEKK
ncbi:MAG TPA: hypothetical protein VKA46_18405 [Gemmataceae bacterium]|nr:hypothetical protein [Gemmataceae bacterium]